MAIAVSALGAGALALIEAPLPLVHGFQPAPVPSQPSTAPAVIYNQSINENENQKSWPSPYPPLLPELLP